MNFMMLLIIGVFALVLLVAFVVLVALLMRTGRRDAPARVSEPGLNCQKQLNWTG